MTWDREPTSFIDFVEDEIASFRTEIALHGIRGVVLRTPVDTGRARGAWTVSYGSPSNTENPPSKNTQGAINSAFRQLTARSREPFEIVYIANNVPYIGSLENGGESGKGTSRQAPDGMLSVTFNEIRVRYSL